METETEMKGSAMKASAAAARVLRPAGASPSRAAGVPESPRDWAEFERAWSAKWSARLGDSRPLLRRLAAETE